MRPKLKLRYYSISGTYRIGRRSCQCSPTNPYELVKEKGFGEIADLKVKYEEKVELLY